MTLAHAVVTAPEPIGALTVGVTEAGLALVAFGDRPDTAQRAAARLGEPLVADPARTTAAAAQLTEYLSGARRAFDLPLDWRLARGFRREVLRAIAAIPFGATASYREVAAGAGSPNAVRAAGTACATNPLPIVVPCHRVLRTDGGLGGYLGGAEMKSRLLDLERAG